MVPEAKCPLSKKRPITVPDSVPGTEFWTFIYPSPDGYKRA